MLAAYSVRIVGVAIEERDANATEGHDGNEYNQNAFQDSQRSGMGFKHSIWKKGMLYFLERLANGGSCSVRTGWRAHSFAPVANPKRKAPKAPCTIKCID